ncbi:venom protease-like protein, partial [Dinothrombium tinctorium]
MGRIIGGKVAKQNAYPWIVVIQSYVDDENFELCGGALINSRYILTAAHCFGRKYVKITARMGSNNRESGGMLLDIAAIYANADFHMNLKHFKRIDQVMNDIGLVKLKTPIEFNETIYPICVMQDENFEPSPKSNLMIAGWGRDNPDKPQVQTKLLESRVEFVPWNICNAFFENTLDHSQLCGKGVTGNACNGDSGGPLMYYDGTKVYVVGIISHGKCVDSPQVYTRVTSHLCWIK